MPGLLVGAGVLFSGIRVGEVTTLELVPERPREVRARIAVAERTPVHTEMIAAALQVGKRAYEPLTAFI